MHNIFESYNEEKENNKPEIIKENKDLIEKEKEKENEVKENDNNNKDF